MVIMDPNIPSLQEIVVFLSPPPPPLEKWKSSIFHILINIIYIYIYVIVYVIYLFNFIIIIIYCNKCIICINVSIFK